MTSRGRSFLAALALASMLARCASSPAPVRGRAASASPASAQVPAFSSTAEAEAALLELEDRRAFDERVLGSAASAAEPGTRARAALAVGRIRNERGNDLLRRLLADRSEEVRSAAAFASAVMGEPALTPELIPLLADPDPRVAAAAARAIGFLARDDGEDALIAAIPSAAAPDPRAAMLESLWRFSNSAAEAAALRYAQDPDPRVRAAALYALSRKPLESSRETITRALADGEPYAAALAARALGLLGKQDSLEPLARALDAGKAPVVINALVALEAILEKNAGASVKEDRRARILALAGDANPNLAVPALVLLRQFAGDRAVFRRLWSIANTGEGRRRQIALLSVTAVLREKAERGLEAAMGSPDPALRAAAAESLVFLPAGAAKPYRERLAGDKEPLVRLALLASLTTGQAVRDNRPLVNSALTDSDPSVRAAAVDALALLQEAAVLPVLAETLAKSEADPSPDVAIAVIGACEKLRAEPGARAIVESAHRQPKTLVSRLARRSLLQVFRADPAAFPPAEYKIGKSRADYLALLAEAKRPVHAQVETGRGGFVIRLASESAPMTAANFVRLARSGFFDGVPIHRVVPNFVLQDGDPTGTGNGGPGYEIRDEINPIEYGRGTVGMALSGPDTGGSQWFVTHSPQPHLNGIYTVFGQIVAGQEIVERIEQGDRIMRVTVSPTP